MTTSELVRRVAAVAERSRPIDVLLWLLAVPFWVIGYGVGLVVFVIIWLASAGVVGFQAARGLGERIE